MPTIGVAVAIPEPWATELQDYRTSVGDAMAATIPTHITLVPPTEVTDEELEEIEEHLAAGRLRGTGVRGPPPRHRHLPSGLAGGVRDRGRGHLPVRAARGRRTPGAARRRPGLPVPPARHHRPPRRRGPARPGLRRAGRLRVPVRGRTTSASTCTTTSGAGRPPATSPCNRVPDPMASLTIGSSAASRRSGSGAPRWTTPCARRSTTAGPRPASRPARSPTSASSRSSRCWRWPSSSSATSPRSSPTPRTRS